MNSCILIAEVIQDPQLRYTPDNNMAIAEMRVQFPGLRPEDPPATLKVLGWGNLAQEVAQTYHTGDRVVVEGRLSMNTVDRPEGFKEKQAELTLSKIYGLGDMGGASSSESTSAPASAPAATPTATATRSKAPRAVTPTPPSSEPDFDDIPF